MHSEVLAAGGYILLFSSIATFGFLLRKQFKQWINTSFYILSMSDILYTVLTASLFLIFDVKMVSITDNTRGNGSFIFPEVWNKNIQFGKHYQIILEDTTESYYNETSNEMFDVPVLCTFKDIIMQYAVILMPLTNTFISLLTFTVQCKLRVMYLKKDFMEFLQLETIKKEQTTTVDTPNTHNNTQCMTESISSQPEINKPGASLNSPIAKQIIGSGRNINNTKLWKFLNLNESRHSSKKIVGGLVLSQWLIPITVTVVLYFAEHIKIDDLRMLENAECDYGTSFFFNKCHNNTASHTAVSHHYFNNETISEIPALNNIQVNEVVLKIQGIVQAMMNTTFGTLNKTSQPTNFYNKSDLLNITQYMIPKLNITKDHEANVQTKFDFLQKISTMRDTTTSSAFENNQNNFSVSETKINKDHELMLFNNLVKKAAVTAFTEKDATMNYETTKLIESSELIITEADIPTTVTEETITKDIIKITPQHSTTFMTRDQIYADILKRIHNSSGNNWLKTYQKNELYNKKQRNQNYISAEEDDTVTESLLPAINKIILNNTAVAQCTKQKCHVSPRFLKAHLLILLFLIYFIPILLCSMMQAHGNISCQLLTTKLKATLETTCEKSDNNVTIQSKPFNLSIDCPTDNPNLEEVCSSSGWFAKCDNENTNDGEQSQTYGSKSNIFDRCTDMMIETENIQNSFNTIKKSLVFGAIMWTPMLLEVLLKVFLCMHVPKLLIDILFLVATGFGALRNILNLGLIRLQNINVNVAKSNSIHPTKY